MAVMPIAQPPPQPRKGILEIRPHMAGLPDLDTPGIVKLASNESAFGASPRAIAAAVRAAESMERYAEQGTGELQAAIGAAFALDPARIVCGPGSDELLTRLMRGYLDAGQQLVYSRHSYAKFANYAWSCGAEPVAAADRDFSADVDAILACVTDRTRMVTLANPCNPTGTHLGEVELRRLREALPGDVILVLDAAYAEYVDAPDYGSPAALVDAFPNVVMTRTLSKIFGLAGARLGWLYAAPPVVDVMRRLGATFPVSAASMAAGIAALADTAHTARVHRENAALRDSFSARLRKLGLHVYPSQTNFVLARFVDAERAAGAYAHLLAEGILTRRFAAPGFGDCVRISIGLPGEMQRCGDCLEEYLGA